MNYIFICMKINLKNVKVQMALKIEKSLWFLMTHEYVTLTNTHKKGRGPKYLKIVGVPLCQCSLNNRAQEGISCASDTLREWPMKGKTRSRNR